MMSRREKTVARKLLAQLVEGFPPPYPVRLQFKDLEDYGDCELVNKPSRHFVVRISHDVNFKAMVPILLHEVAHAVAWFWEEEDHGPIFGHAYSRLWQLWREDD